MSMSIKNKARSLCALAIGLLTSAYAYSMSDIGVTIGWGQDNVHYHAPYRGGYYEGGGYYHGHAWRGPNVIINVPVERYHVPHCDQVEVCDAYDQCWLERYCD